MRVELGEFRQNKTVDTFIDECQQRTLQFIAQLAQYRNNSSVTRVANIPTCRRALRLMALCRCPATETSANRHV